MGLSLNGTFVYDGTFSKETYFKKSNEIKTDIINKKIQLNDYESQFLNVDEFVSYSKQFFLQ